MSRQDQSRANRPWADRRGPARRKAYRPGLIVVSAFAVTIALGTLALLLPFMSTAPGSVRLDDAFFTATSAVTVTGLSTIDTGTGWTAGGKAVILLLIQVGGLGISTIGTVLMLILTRRLGLSSRLLAQAETPWVSLGEVVREDYDIRFNWYGESPGVAAWHGVFHSISAFNNAGFSLFPDSLVPFARDPWILLTVMAAIIAGRLADRITVLEEALEPSHGVHRFLAVEYAGRTLIVGAVDQVAAESLDNRAEAVGEPLARTVVELEVEGIFDFGQIL